jgi:hypothetical protein
MMSTRSPGLTGFAITCALTILKCEPRAKRASSPYAIPRIVTGLLVDHQKQSIKRTLKLLIERGY